MADKIEVETKQKWPKRLLAKFKAGVRQLINSLKLKGFEGSVNINQKKQDQQQGGGGGQNGNQKDQKALEDFAEKERERMRKEEADKARDMVKKVQEELEKKKAQMEAELQRQYQKAMQQMQQMTGTQKVGGGQGYGADPVDIQHRRDCGCAICRNQKSGKFRVSKSLDRKRKRILSINN